MPRFRTPIPTYLDEYDMPQSARILIIDVMEHYGPSLQEHFDIPNWTCTLVTDLLTGHQNLLNEGYDICCVGFNSLNNPLGQAFLREASEECYRIAVVNDETVGLAAVQNKLIDTYLPVSANNNQCKATILQGLNVYHVHNQNNKLLEAIQSRNRDLEQLTTSLKSLLDAREEDLHKAHERLKDYQNDLMQAELHGITTQLVGGLVHEFNNPLAVILGHSQRLARLETVNIDDLKRRMGIIGNEINHCLSLIENLRNYATPINEKISSYRMNGIITVALDHRSEREENSIPIEIEDDIPLIQGARRSLSRVVEQIIANAIAHQATEMRVSSNNDKQVVHIHFDNNGLAPGDEAIHSAVKPFFTTHPNPTARGLGLALAHSLLRDMGGSITINRIPEQEQGCRCTITLPISERAYESGANPIPVINQQEEKIIKVLIVDDEPMVAELLSDALEEEGLNSEVQNCRSDAAAAIANGDFSAILCDANLPDGDGTDFLRKTIKEHPQLRGHCALVTGDPDNPKLRTAASELSCPVLGKPFRFDALSKIIARIV